MKTLALSEVSQDIREIVSPHSDVVKEIGIFGSLARGDYHKKSDIDLIVEFNLPAEFSMELFEKFCGLCNQIEELLSKTYGCKVDIVHIEGGSLDALFDKSAANEVVWL